jgi:hypothetical protein
VAGVLDDDHGVAPHGVEARPLTHVVLEVVEVADQLAGGSNGLQATLAMRKRDPDVVDLRHRPTGDVDDGVQGGGQVARRTDLSGGTSQGVNDGQRVGHEGSKSGVVKRQPLRSQSATTGVSNVP